MPNIIAVDDDIVHAVDRLKDKLGGDEEATALLAIVVTSWNQLALLYEESEQRHGTNVAGAASFLSLLSLKMTELKNKLAATEQNLKDLHTKVVNTLGLASGNINKAKTAMQDVLNEYNNFQGTTQALKKGLGSLVLSTLTTLNPAVGAIVAPMVNQVFGTPT